jgi:hypothetical protein
MRIGLRNRIVLRRMTATSGILALLSLTAAISRPKHAGLTDQQRSLSSHPSVQGGGQGARQAGSPPTPATVVDPSKFGETMSGLGRSAADQKRLREFQQAMLQVAAKASNGDTASRLRLEQWQSIVLRHRPEIAATTNSANAGDKRAARALQQLQMTLVHEWMHGSAPRTSATKP